MAFLDTPVKVSQLGALLYDNVKFPAGKYITLEGETVEYPLLEIDVAQFIVSRSKTIIKTPISLREGTIKQLTGIGDFEIALNGKLNGGEGFPDDDLQAFADIENSPQEIPVLSKILNDFFKITTVVIERASFNSPVGTLNEIVVSMQMVSDDSIDLRDFKLT